MIQPPHDESIGRDVYVVRDRNGRLTCEVPALPSDIDAHVAFSYTRVLYSIVGILLALSDIPRTGFSISLYTYYPKVGPGTAMFYGPYAYPVVHLNRTNAGVSGFCGESQIDSVDLWPYKFDSLSIPTRALAEHLAVKSYPACVLYKYPCERTTLALPTVFDMVNNLLDSVEKKYFANSTRGSPPLVFTTTNRWADRLHHVILGKLGKRIDSRTHTVHHFTVPATAPLGLNVCEARSRAPWHHPYVCNCVIAWRCDHPTLGTDVQVSVAKSIFLRVAALQLLYPNATLDVTLITTRSRVQNLRLSFPTAFFDSDNTEVTTLVRGRYPQRPEYTVFLDDYRYERATAETSAAEISTVTGTLRGLSQGYIWLRVVLLVSLSYKVRLAEAKHRSAPLVIKARVVLATFLRVPSHTIIYGSWFPIIAYSIAHCIDSSIVHLLSDNYWSTINGLFTFDFVTFVKVSSILMRNIWLIVLFWKSAMMVYNSSRRHRNRPWQPQHGLLTFRGSFIGAMSLLTIFAFFRAIPFRDCRVLSITEIARNAGDASYTFSRSHIDTVADFGFRQDIKTITISSGIVTVVVLLVRALTGVYRRRTASSFFCRSFYVPFSVGRIFPAAGLNPFWLMELHPIEKRIQSPQSITNQLKAFFGPRVLSLIVPFPCESKKRICEICDFIPMPLHWKPIQGCRRHQKIFNVGFRSPETQSMVRLAHIGMFSDPIVHFRLRVLGEPMYLYRITLWSRRQTTSANKSLSIYSGDQDSTPHDRMQNHQHVTFLLLPLMKQEIGRHRSKHASSSEMHLVAVVSSSIVPWGLLADCG